MFFSYNIVACFMGFMSGMTLLLSGNTMNFWLTTCKVDKTAIGIFALISLPYAISFVWSPLLDHIKIPFLTRFFGMRYSWILCLQVFLSIAVYMLSKISPTENIIQFALVGLIIAFLSSTQDVALGALRAEIIPKNIQASTAGIYIFGYRLGMLIGSSGAIYASVYISWEKIYVIFSNIILYFPIILYITIYRAQKIEHDIINSRDQRVSRYISLSFWKNALHDIGPRHLVITILIFLVLYRLPDNFISVMINPFLVETGFDAISIATVGKFLGIITAIIGGMISGHIMKKMNILDSLLYFGILHALSHLLFIVQNNFGANIYVLFVVVGIESITGGMVMASYIAFITSLCNGKYSATQYAFLSSMMGISRAVFPSISGIIVINYGWNNFFLFITLLTIPPIYLVIRLRGLFDNKCNL